MYREFSSCTYRYTYIYIYISYSHRRKEGLLQARSGPSTSFDDLLVLALGSDWRWTRDSSSKLEWKKRSQEMVELVCSLYQLPLDPRMRSTQPTARCFVPSCRTAEETTAEYAVLAQHCREQAHLSDNRWKHDRQRFKCVVDNQLLANIVNGKARLQDDSQ